MSTTIVIAVIMQVNRSHKEVVEQIKINDDGYIDDIGDDWFFEMVCPGAIVPHLGLVIKSGNLIAHETLCWDGFRGVELDKINAHAAKLEAWVKKEIIQDNDRIVAKKVYASWS